MNNLSELSIYKKLKIKGIKQMKKNTQNAGSTARLSGFALNPLIIILLLLLFIPTALLSAKQWVKVAKIPEEGWKLLVDGEAMAVHGMVWSYVPIGENYSYSLWNQPREIIQKMIDTDAALMKEMGVNAIRVFSDVPPEWIEYIYQRYGIYTVVNDLFGRYGLSVDGRWHGRTNYSDIRTREIILENLRKNISRYADVPGVLFYLLGNENNYGLEWDSDQIENIPVGQRMEVRAGYLYSLFEEGIRIVKELDPTKPVGIVNGDIQYLNIIKALVPSLDVLGVNTYRGRASFDLFYESVAESIDLPIVYTEFGADAYNVAEEREDQYSQADYMKSQWEEIYRQSYNKDGYQNILGGFVFEWMDEWWKSAGMVLELDVHNTSATWSNGAYEYDAGFDVNNMNEEWWGIVAQSPVKTDGIHERRLRAAYYVLKEIWSLDQVNCTVEEIDSHFAFDIQSYVNQAEIGALKQEKKESRIVDFRGRVDFVGVSAFDDIGMDSKEPLDNFKSSAGELAYLGVDLNPYDGVKAGVTFRVQGHVPDSTFEDEEYTPYEANELSADAFVDTTRFPSGAAGSGDTYANKPSVQIYDAYLNWETTYANLDFYYHNGHSDWVAEGDYFHLLPESFDYVGMDIAGSVAPFGIELTGKQFLDGLKLYGGPEIHWGASPQLMAKYYKPGERLSWSLMYNEVVSGNENEDPGHGRRASGWIGLNFLPWFTLGFGTLFSGMEYIGDPYTHVEKTGEDTYSISDTTSEFDILDTLSFKTDLTSEIFLYTKLFAKYIYAGRLAASNAYTARTGTQISDVGTGNRHEFTGGFQFQYGMLSIMPQFLARIPLSYAINTDNPRKSLASPLAVYNNREAYQMELIVALDPTGDTYFFDWNNSDRENAKLAGYISWLYTFFEGPTDATHYKNEYGDWAQLTGGLAEVRDIWSLKGRLVWNAAPKLRFIAGLQGGHDQSWGQDARLINYWGGSLAMRAGTWLISSSIDFDTWGKADWYRQLNITYPLQWTLDISKGFDIPSFLNSRNRIGLRWKGRTYDEYAPDDETALGEQWRMELMAYLSFSW